MMKENFLNLTKEIDIQVQETQRVTKKMDPKSTIPRHIKLPKVKDNLKSKKRKADSYLQKSSRKTIK